MKRFLIVAAWGLVLVPLLCIEANAGLRQKLGIAGYEWLKIGQSARSTGMGDAGAAVVEGIEGAFVNPAALMEIERFEYSFNYTAWLVDTKLGSGAVGFRAGNTVWGLSVISFNPPSSKETTILQPRGTGEMVETSGLAVGILFGYQFTDKFSIGSQVRYIREKLYTDRTQTLDVNFGTKFHSGYRGMRLAMSLQNLGKDFRYADVLQSNFMPTVFNVGLAMEIAGEQGDPYYLTVSGENSYHVDFENRAQFGAELWAYNILALRAGYKWNYTGTYTLGAGLQRKFGGKDIRLDFSYNDFGEFLNTPMRFSLSGTF